MCCFFKSRKTPAIIVFILAMLGVVAGIAMIYFSIALNNSEFFDKIGELDDLQEDINFDNIRTLIFGILLAFSLISLIAAACGMLACKIKHRCFTCTYGIFLLPIWLVVFIVGAVSVWLANTAPDLIQDACETLIDNFNDAVNDNLNSGSSSSIPAGALQGCDKETYDSDIKFNLEVYESMKIDKEMCSINCPCIPNENSSDWTDISTASIGRCRDWNFLG